MKYLCVFLMFLSTTVYGQMLNWSDPVTVNDDPAKGYTRPDVVLAGDGIPVVQWAKFNNEDVFISRMIGSAFSPPLKINPDGITVFAQDWAGPTVANSGDTIFVAIKSQPEKEGYIYLVRSVDGGKSFGDTQRVSDSTWSRFPHVTVMPGGNPVVTYMGFEAGWKDPGYVVSRSLDGGNSFSIPVEASKEAPGEVCDCCPGFIMNEGQDIYVLFRNNDQNLRDMWTSISNDGGMSFIKSADVDRNGWMINVCPSSGPDAMINGDSVVVVWMSGASGKSKANIGTFHKRDLEVEVNAEITSESGFVNQNYPKIAGSGDTIGVVWINRRDGKVNVMFVHTTKGAADLAGQTPVPVNDTGTQFPDNPQIAYRNGVFHVVYTDVQNERVVYRNAKVGSQSGRKDLSKTRMIRVYPNPVSEELFVELPLELSGGELRLIDVSGKVIMLEEIRGRTATLKTSNLAPSIYILKYLKDDKIIMIDQLIIQ